MKMGENNNEYNKLSYENINEILVMEGGKHRHKIKH